MEIIITLRINKYCVTNAGKITSYQINGLSEYLLYNDFAISYIERSKLPYTGNNVFLSLDSYDELLMEEWRKIRTGIVYGFKSNSIEL